MEHRWAWTMKQLLGAVVDLGQDMGSGAMVDLAHGAETGLNHVAVVGPNHGAMEDLDRGATMKD